MPCCGLDQDNPSIIHACTCRAHAWHPVSHRKEHICAGWVFFRSADCLATTHVVARELPKVTLPDPLSGSPLFCPLLPLGKLILRFPMLLFVRPSDV